MTLDIDKTLGEALLAHQAGRLAEAEALYQRVLQMVPGHPDCLNLLGLIAHLRGQPDRALRLIGQAIDNAPRTADFHNNRGEVLRALGRGAEAAANYRHAIALVPDYLLALNNLGITLKADGWTASAIACYRRLLVWRPDYADALNNLGTALQLAETLDQADQAFQRAVAIRPSFAAALNNRGNLLRQQDRLDEAIFWFSQAVACNPAYGEAYANLGGVFRIRNQFAKALAALRKAVVFRPEHADTLCNLASALTAQRRFSEAKTALKRAIAADVGLAEAYSSLGTVLWRQFKMDDAIDCHRYALALKPNFGGAMTCLATNWLNTGHLSAAACGLDRALALEKNEKSSISILRIMMANVTYRDDLAEQDVRRLNQRFDHQLHDHKPVQVAFASLPPRQGRLRLGYLSSDLCNHPVGNSMLEAVRHHNRSAFETFFYADVDRPDEVTAAIQSAADGWCDVVGWSDAELVERIRADGIQILVCLAGRFDMNRPQIAIWRAAPVQISMHDVATSGMTEMDYVIGDRWLLPCHSAEHFSEHRLRLPHFFLGERPRSLPEIELREPLGPPVFGCCNSPSKITPTALRLWGRILAARPDARLILKYRNSYASRWVRGRLVDGLTAAGAALNQIDMVNTDFEPIDTFLAKYNRIDVALDTLPFSGSTTSFQALTMGVPVVTWPLDRMVSRWTEAMLRVLGLSELVADSADDYVAIALRLVEDRAAWRLRRDEIRRMVEVRLCDGKSWTGHLERLYLAVWNRYVAANPSRPGLSQNANGDVPAA